MCACRVGVQIESRKMGINFVRLRRLNHSFSRTLHSVPVTSNYKGFPKFVRPYLTQGGVMLKLSPNCECCNKDLPPESADARICSFECTFCASCADSVLGGKCPNCGGELVPRPRRPANKLEKYPASKDRVYNPLGCGRAA